MQFSSQSWPKRMITSRSSSARMAWSTLRVVVAHTYVPTVPASEASVQPVMSRSGGLAVLLLLVLAARAAAAIKPLEEQPQDGKQADHLTAGAAIEPSEEQPQDGKRAEPLTAGAAIEPSEEQPQGGKRADNLTAGAAIKPAEEQAQDGKGADHLTAAAAIKPAEEQAQDGKRAGHLAAAKGLLGEEPAARLASVRAEEKKDSDDAATMPLEGMKPGGGVAIQQGGDPGTVPSASSGSGEHGKEESGAHAGKEESGGSTSSKEGEKSAAKSCLTKEECHKKRLLCGKGCTLSAHAKCAAKCSKSCIATC